MSDEYIEVMTESGVDRRRVAGEQGGAKVPELRPGETMLIGGDGRVRIVAARGNRCAACAAWLSAQGVKCAKLEAGGIHEANY